jgi:phage terminase large subunit-like protein
MVQATRPWTSSETAGSVQPRLSTPPLIQGSAGPCGCGCALTTETSYGFDVIDFAKRVLKEPLDPWQEWLVIHAGELLPDGRTPRFRQVLVLVARQNGKTHVLKVLSLFWLYIERVGLVLGTSTNLDYAKESWEKAVTLAEDTPALTREIKSVRRANGEQTLTVAGNGRYKIAASNRRGGRSLTVHRLIMDELREHHDWSSL